MKPLIHKLGIVLCLLVLFSCKKDHNDTPSNGTRLSKVIVWSSSFPSYPSISVNQFYYDALNRVSKIDYSNGDSAKGESGAKYAYSTKWFYNGNEQLPYKYTIADDSTVFSELYFFYDNQGRLVLDSLPTPDVNTYTIKKYNWLPGRVLTITAKHEMGIIAMSTDSSQINSQNCLAQFGTSYAIGSGMPAFYYTYDNKINPLHTLNIHAALPFTSIGGVGNLGFSENNQIELKTGFFRLFGSPAGTFSPTGSATNKYNYNAHNLPVNCEMTTDGNIIGKSKSKFYYTN